VDPVKVKSDKDYSKERKGMKRPSSC
jgi:hypothetical protein